MQNTQNTPSTTPKLPQIDPSSVVSYRVFRSPTQAMLANVVAVDSSNNPLFVREADMTILNARELCAQLNHEEFGEYDE